MIEKPALPVPPNLAGRNGGYDCTWQSPFGLKLLRSGHEETTGRMPFSSVEIINRSSSGIGYSNRSSTFLRSGMLDLHVPR
jgi:hypothetical protein